MNMQYVETNRLKENPGNLFSPMAGKEYAELKDSIRENGVLEPLMVVKGDGGYMVLCGHNRLRVAKELEIMELPCQLAPLDLAEEIAIETELFRRHLTREEKDNIVKLKSERYKERNEKLVREKLHPDLLAMYNNNNLQNVAHIMKMTIPEQGYLVQALKKVVEKEVPSTALEAKMVIAPVPGTAANKELERLKKDNKALQGEIVNLKGSLDELNSEITNKEDEVREIKANTAELRKLYDKKKQEFEKTLEKAIADPGQAVSAEIQGELDARQKNLVEMSKTVQERQKQIDELKDTIATLNDRVLDKESAANAILMAKKDLEIQLKKERERFANPALLQRRLDNLVAELDTLIEHVIHYNWDETTLQSTEKTGEIIEARIAKLVAKMRETVVVSTPGQLKVVKAG